MRTLLISEIRYTDYICYRCGRVFIATTTACTTCLVYCVMTKWFLFSCNIRAQNSFERNITSGCSVENVSLRACTLLNKSSHALYNRRYRPLSIAWIGAGRAYQKLVTTQSHVNRVLNHMYDSLHRNKCHQARSEGGGRQNSENFVKMTFLENFSL